MLNRTQFFVAQIFSLAIGLALVLGAIFVVNRFVAAAWLKWLLGIVAIGCAQTVSQWFAGGHTSYRKYAAAHGGPDVPPSQFWATTGQVVVLAFVAAVLIVVTTAANRAADESWVHAAAAIAWVGLPGVTLLFLLVARDWRRELASRTPGCNEAR